MAIRYLLFFLLFTPELLTGQSIPIEIARSMPLGSTITIRGLVTNGPELGIIRYMQDGSAGIAAYPGSGSVAGFADTAMPGDSMEITGTLVDYHGLLEINPINSYSKIASGQAIPSPKLIKLSDISEAYESQLVAFECLVFPAGGGVFSSGAYDVIDDDGNAVKVYLQSGHPMAGSIIPGTPIFLSAILSRYNDFQLLIRYPGDFSSGTCFYFTDELEQSAISSTGFNLSWSNNLSAQSKLHYGSTPALGTSITVAGTVPENNYTLTGLLPGTIYWAQIEAEHNGAKIFSQAKPFATQSLSSGQIKVYFTRDIDPLFANGFMPEGQSSTEVMDETIARINAAEQTLDVAMYNNNRTALVNALTEAHNRGVRVRYVADEDASNNALNPAPPFPIIYSNGSAIMHNKFLVIDADMTDKAWVMSGSLNWTTQNIFNDFNNTLFIQDQSLARGYEIEFEEMWGSDGSMPDPQIARFGTSKRDDTPHNFIIGGQQVNSWFSPSDQTTKRIVETVYTTDEEALFATFSFTKDEIGDALIDMHNNQRAVRGMIENISDPGAEITNLKAAGIDCRPHAFPGELHHKYGVFDANSSDPIVLTGSHNWSISAETVNDENTLVIHDYRLSSLFKAEFEKRWQGISASSYSPVSVGVKLFPNPVNEQLNVESKDGLPLEIQIRNTLGVVVHVQRYDNPTNRESINVLSLPAGHYFAVIHTEHELFTIPFQKI